MKMGRQYNKILIEEAGPSYNQEEAWTYFLPGNTIFSKANNYIQAVIAHIQRLGATLRTLI
jgi:hypothetical protein